MYKSFYIRKKTLTCLGNKRNFASHVMLWKKKFPDMVDTILVKLCLTLEIRNMYVNVNVKKEKSNVWQNIYLPGESDYFLNCLMATKTPPPPTNFICKEVICIMADSRSLLWRIKFQIKKKRKKKFYCQSLMSYV